MKTLILILTFLSFRAQAQEQFFMLANEPVTSNITYVGAGTTAGGIGGASPGYPTGIQAGNILVAKLTFRYSTATAPTVAGWTKQVTTTAAIGADAEDAGSVVTVIYTTVATGTETGTKAFTVTGAGVTRAQMYAFSNTGTGWDIATASASDNTAGNDVSGTFGASVSATTGDVILTLAGTNTDAFNVSDPVFSVPGLTTTRTELFKFFTNSGVDAGHINSMFTVIGTQSGPGTYSFTATQNLAGSYPNANAYAISLLRLRQVNP